MASMCGKQREEINGEPVKWPIANANGAAMSGHLEKGERFAQQQSSLSPVFIHSLFRAGSTYLFHVFRRSKGKYWCYQEALHEIVEDARSNPESLLQGIGRAEMRLYRHPNIGRPYFAELYEAWPSWKDVFVRDSVFGAYFAPPAADIGIQYFRALAQAARGRPVFQECRTSGRIRAIKEQLGGVHIYLWRNPWDQWWSHKVTEYFDVANQLILNAPNAPSVLQLLQAEFQLTPTPITNLQEARERFVARPLTSAESYAVFYSLWCLALDHGLHNSDVSINIDRLSESQPYRDEVLAKLTALGVNDLNFDDCSCARASYAPQERRFFRTIERRVRTLFLSSGYCHERWRELEQIRQRMRVGRKQPAEQVTDPQWSSREEQASRAREMSRKYETAHALAVRQNIAESAINGRRIDEAAAHIARLEKDCVDIGARGEAAEQRCAELSGLVNEAREAHERAVAALAAAEASASAANQRAEAAERRCAALQQMNEDSRETHERIAAALVAAETSAAGANERAAIAEQRCTALQQRNQDSREAHQRVAAALVSAEASAAGANERAAIAEQRCDTLQRALDDLRQSSDRTSTALAVVEARAEGASAALEQCRRELSEVHESNHYHWQLAQLRESQVLEIQQSSAWRCTAPLRWSITALRKLGAQSANAISVAIVRPIGQFVIRRPALRVAGASVLRHFPRTRQRLRNVLLGRPTEKTGDGNAIAQYVSPIDALTPEAQHIYDELRKAIERKRRAK